MRERLSCQRAPSTSALDPRAACCEPASADEARLAWCKPMTAAPEALASCSMITTKRVMSELEFSSPPCMRRIGSMMIKRAPSQSAFSSSKSAVGLPSETSSQDSPDIGSRMRFS